MMGATPLATLERLAPSKELREAAQKPIPKRWSCDTGEWLPVGELWPNPDNSAAEDVEISRNAA
jgi:hypothetical protein